MNYFKYTLIILFFFTLQTKGQIIVQDNKKLEKIKSGNTYIMVGSVKFPNAAKFLAAAKENWTLSKSIDFLSPDHLSQITPNDSFLSLEALTETRGSLRNIYFYLTFWTCKEKFFKGARDLRQSDHEPVASACLSVDIKAFNASRFFKENDFDGGGLLYNWSPGMFKNTLQQMTRLLNSGSKVKLQDDITNKIELAKLKTETLYVPDFNLIKFSPFLGKSKTPADEEKIFDDYKLPYQVINKDDLEPVIFASRPSYYLIFIKDSSSKIVCVINSKTGETIYSRATSISYNLKSGDLKDLYKEINR